MQLTPIEWADYSANLLRYRDATGKTVWACVHASEGCRFCYSEAMTPRYGGRGSPFTKSNMDQLTPYLDEKELHKMLTYKPASGKTCFVGDMTDIFGGWVPDELLDRMFAVFALRPDVTWLLLTKRAERMRAYMADPGYRSELVGLEAEGISGLDRHRWDLATKGPNGELTGVPQTWTVPLPNVWLGVSVESQNWADQRIPHLLATPAAKRFISLEPQLERVDLDGYLYIWECKVCGAHPDSIGLVEHGRGCHTQSADGGGESFEGPCSKLDWVIQGGESGPGARPFNVKWARFTRDQCREAGVAYFAKQLGSLVQGDYERAWDVEKELVGSGLYRMNLKNRKGGDPAEWPEDLRVREWPQ